MAANAALFGVAGPLVGVPAFLVMAVMQGPASVMAETLLFPRVLVVSAFLVFGAYVLGTIPSVLTGIVLGAVSHGRGWSIATHAACGACIGVLVTTICCVATEALTHMPPLALLAIGAISGCVCAALSRHLAPRAADDGI